MESNINPWVLFIGIIVLISFISFIFAFGGAYLVYKVANKFTSKKYSKIIALTIPIYLGYIIYRSFFPPDDFYLNEFKDITQEENVQDIEILYGYATFPIFHPDYCSEALLLTTKVKYDSILTKIRNDNRLIISDSISQGMGSVIYKKFKLNEPIYAFHGINEFPSNELYYIGFLRDNKIVIHKCLE